MRVGARWWPFATHAITIIAAPVAWFLVLVQHHALVFIFLLPVLTLVAWILAIPGLVSGWRFDRPGAGSGSVAAFCSCALAVLFGLGVAFLLPEALRNQGLGVTLGSLSLLILAAAHAVAAASVLRGRTAAPTGGRPAGPAAKRRAQWGLALLAVEAAIVLALHQDHVWVSGMFVAFGPAGLDILFLTGSAAMAGWLLLSVRRPESLTAALVGLSVHGIVVLMMLASAWVWSGFVAASSVATAQSVALASISIGKIALGSVPHQATRPGPA